MVLVRGIWQPACGEPLCWIFCQSCSVSLVGEIELYNVAAKALDLISFNVWGLKTASPFINGHATIIMLLCLYSLDLIRHIQYNKRVGYALLKSLVLSLSLKL